jgi:dipeptidyl aminopeptidase/acylaminoacyl peptidase
MPVMNDAESDLRRTSGTVFIRSDQTFRYRSPAAQFAAVTSLLGFDWLTEMDAYLNSPAPAFRISAKNFLGQRSFPLGFDAEPDVVYFASNLGRDTYGLYALNLVTKQRLDFALEEPHWDLADPIDAFNESLLVFDRDGKLAGIRAATFDGRTKWVNAQLATVQQKLEAMFSDRLVEIVDWDTSQRRFLVLVFSTTDPGRYYLAEQRDRLQITELLRRSPGLTATRLNRSVPFAFDTPTGVHLTGTLTLPRRSRIVPPPLVVVCRDIPGHRETPEFSREVQAAAAMGFAVATVNYRGVAGFGMKHRDAVRDGFDTIPVEDIRAAVSWLTSHYAVNSKRVALFGYGFGGYIALRAAQLFPDEFRCVVSVNAPTDLMDWNVEGTKAGMRDLPDLAFEVRQEFFERSRLAGRSVIEHVSAKDRPVLILQDPTKNDLRESQGLGLRNALRRAGRTVEYLPINGGTAVANPAIRARVFGQIAGFLNDHLYDFSVDVGTEKEVK